MRTTRQIELTPIVVPLRSLTARAAAALLTFATAIIPVLAADASGAAAAAEHPDTVRPFRINVLEAALVDLRRRIAATRWPDQETVTDQSQLVQLAKIQELVRYWGTDYDWRKEEAKLNALPQRDEMLDFASRHDVAPPTEHFPKSIINEAFARLDSGKASYHIVLDPDF